MAFPDLLGLLLPERFIPQVEQNGLMEKLGEWAIETACRQNKHWQDLGLLHFPIALNK